MITHYSNNINILAISRDRTVFCPYKITKQSRMSTLYGIISDTKFYYKGGDNNSIISY